MKYQRELKSAIFTKMVDNCNIKIFNLEPAEEDGAPLYSAIVLESFTEKEFDELVEELGQDLEAGEVLEAYREAKELFNDFSYFAKKQWEEKDYNKQ